MEGHYPDYDKEEISKWELIRETPYSASNYVKTAYGEFTVDIHYTAEKILTVTIGHKGYLSKIKLEPIMKQCCRLALARGNYKIINYTLVGGDDIDFGNYTIGENK